jgi:hypothetical protein
MRKWLFEGCCACARVSLGWDQRFHCAAAIKTVGDSYLIVASLGATPVTVRR